MYNPDAIECNDDLNYLTNFIFQMPAMKNQY